LFLIGKIKIPIILKIFKIKITIIIINIEKTLNLLQKIELKLSK